MAPGDALVALGGAFLAAGILGRLGGRIGLPTIPLFMLAGIAFGPHTPGLALVRDPGELRVVAALGLIFLLFYLGLEFSLDDLTRGGARLAGAGAGYILLNVGGGLAFGFALGWGVREALVLAGVIGISSSAIVTKVLVDLGRLGNPESRLILGIIVVEDVFLALYLAALQPVLGGADTVAAAALSFGRAFAFLLVLAAVARWGTRLVQRLVDTRDDELLVVMFTGLAVLTAGIAEELGVSDAIGAFMAGLILASTRAAPRIRALVHPLRDAFAALFFFAFGLAIDPGDVLSVAVPIAVAVVLTVALNVAAGIGAARLNGFGAAEAANVGLTVLSRGEFALVLASMALAAGLDGRLAPFIAGYVLVLALLGPVLAARSDALLRLVTRRRTPVA
ncbi:CPA2 family monovalent cation:H+ antiporter-2 [Thermocatellispora tengchongensis]|uniref:CPA2 family monovalent cation:H+ antiporter-2 n=1 Tax=Thermocatellispora tengchongensis TaxID=1073253 RepID=A0A840PK55_9ACTN|nr:cation:proton antiporter [Thermocatellispora tengchongensis]MBB5138303.1 CPA2 family monovalent cation:H+ antiporter-2 [Thermocatellispora tengchongensis]